MSIIERAFALSRKISGLILPMFAGARDFAGLGRGPLWALRLLALAVTLAILRAINYALGLQSLLEPPVPLLGHFWLPLLFLLLYIFGWLAWWLWKQFGSEREVASFPDIEQAWREAVRALERAGIGLNETPLFLVLGRPQKAEGALFDGAELALKVRGQPSRDDAPVRVYANPEAIYVTCAGASALALGSAIVEPVEDDLAAEPADEGPDFLTYSGIPGQAATEAEREILDKAWKAGRGPGQLFQEELEALGRLAAVRSNEPSGYFQPSQSPTHDKASVELQEARLRHIGRLIALDRRPYCPINGILLLIPISSTNSDHAATRVGQLCHYDLNAVRESTAVRCPVFALVPDLEDLPGFGELILRLPQDERRRRMGQRFPLMPDLSPGELPSMFDGGVNWIASKQFPSRVDILWRVESPSGGLTMAEAVRGNVLLYHLLRQVRRRLRRLGRVLSHAVFTEGKPSAMLGGCYLAGIGANPRTEQAFVPGVFRRLTEDQDFVSWTPERLAREASYDRKVLVGYIVLGSLTLLFVALIAFALLFTNSPPSS